MATIAELEQKYFPASLPPAPAGWEETRAILHIDGDAYFAAIAKAVEACQGPDDRIWFTSWVLEDDMRLRGNSVPPLGQWLVEKAHAAADVRAVISVPRFGIGTSNMGWHNAGGWIGAAGGALLGPQATHRSIRSVRQLRRLTIDGKQPLEGRMLIDWGGDVDSRHEKTTIVYNAATKDFRAFVGGLDFAASRFGDEMHRNSWWHDAGVELRSGAALVAAANFVTRWTEARTLPNRRYRFDGVTEWFNPWIETTPPSLPSESTLPSQSNPDEYQGASVRIARSYDTIRAFSPWLNERNLPWATLPATGIREVLAVLVQAIGAAKNYIYVEDQTLNPPALLALYQSHDALFPLVRAACARGVKVVFVTQGFVGPGLPAPLLEMSNHIRDGILEPLTSTQRLNFALFHVRDTKVHSKLVLVDDEFVSIGSANFWDRSMRGIESELNAAIVHVGSERSLVADLRVRLWCGHLRLAPTAPIDTALRNLSSGFGIFRLAWGAGLGFTPPGSALVEMTP